MAFVFVHRSFVCPFRLDSNLEKKAESTLSLVKLYQFYTDMCQQAASFVVEMDVFKTVRITYLY